MSNDGGTAFPVAIEHVDQPVHLGMSLRDWFAGQALAGGLEQGVEHNMAGELDPSLEGWWHPSYKLAARAYAIADAMLAEREKATEQH